MNPTPALGLPVAIEVAVRRVKLAARGAVERTVDSLGVSALASANASMRENLLSAQFELNRKLAVFCNCFNEALDHRVEREVLPHGSAHAALSETSWDALSLVDDQEMETQLSAERLGIKNLAGDAVRAILDKAPGNDAPIGGVKVITDNGWFAARPSGTEDVYKLYAESFVSPTHLREIQTEAKAAVAKVLGA